jgi:HTH-type transcriptional regulator/antitoxin HipB
MKRHDRAESWSWPVNATELGTTVESRRKALRLGQEELAELAGVSVRFLRSLEHGKVSARLDKVFAVLDTLGLEVAVKVRQP